MKKIKIKFKNIEALNALIVNIHDYRESQVTLYESCKNRDQLYYNALLRVSLCTEIHNSMYRFMYSDSRKYPSEKSFNLHESIIIQEALQFNNVKHNPYLQNLTNIMLAEINQQIES